MRLLSLAVSLVVTAGSALAQSPEGIDWQLLAMDGVVVDSSVTATLRIETDGSVTGKAPCNDYGGKISSVLPEFTLGPVRATRMACDKLAEERAFFDTLALMQRAAMDGERNLIMTGPDGRSMEFVLDRMNSLTTCKTCSD